MEITWSRHWDLHGCHGCVAVLSVYSTVCVPCFDSNVYLPVEDKPCFRRDWRVYGGMCATQADDPLKVGSKRHRILNFLNIVMYITWDMRHTTPSAAHVDAAEAPETRTPTWATLRSLSLHTHPPSRAEEEKGFTTATQETNGGEVDTCLHLSVSMILSACLELPSVYRRPL